jgi:hypothetical protein
MADAWFEEDQQIYDHPKNPYTRIDILPSSRKIEVKLGGVTIAESSNPSFLFETGLRTRFYLPKTSVSLIPILVSNFGAAEVDGNRLNGNTFPRAKRRVNAPTKVWHSTTT